MITKDELIERIACELTSQYYENYEQKNTQCKEEYVGYMWDKWIVEANRILQTLLGSLPEITALNKFDKIENEAIAWRNLMEMKDKQMVDMKEEIKEWDTSAFEQLTQTQQALDSAVEALKEIERAIPIETPDKLGLPLTKITRITLEALASIKE